MPIVVKDLQNVLDHPELRAAFETFGKAGSSSENLDFFDAVNDYKKAAANPAVTDDELRQKAKLIASKHTGSTTGSGPDGATTNTTSAPKAGDAKIDLAAQLGSPGESPFGETPTRSKQLELNDLDAMDMSAFGDLTAQGGEINLRAKTGDNLKAGLASIDTQSRAELSTLFDESQKEIRGLMEIDNFGRFKASPTFDQAVAKINEGMRPVDERVARISELEKKLDALKTPTMADKFKAFFKGGMDNVRKEVMDKIDQVKLDLMRIEDPETLKTLQKRNQNTIDELKQERAEVSQKYVEALHTAQHAAVVEGMLGGNLTEDQLAKVRQERSDAIDTMDRLEGPMKARKGMSDEIKNLEKHVSVRETLGDQVDGHSHGHDLHPHVK